MSTRPSHKGNKKSSKSHKKTPGRKGQGISFSFPLRRIPREIMPDRFRTTLTYVDQFVLNASSASTDNYVFRANSLYDPNLTGTGHQPLGYDQITTFYSNWSVSRASVKLTMTPPNLAVNTPQIDNVIIAITPRRNDASAISSVLTALEQPYTEWTLCAGYSRPPTMSLSIDCPRFFGVSPSVYQSSLEYSGGIGANPTQVLHFVVTAGSTAAGTTDPDPIYVTAEFEFQATFYNMITLATS